jgi:hypothetical protein
MCQGVYGPLCGLKIKSGSKLEHRISKNLTYYLDCRKGLETTVNIKDRQGVIQGMMLMVMMMMMIFSDVAQSAVKIQSRSTRRSST